MKYDTFRDYVERLYNYGHDLIEMDEALGVDISASIFGEQIDNMAELLFLAVNSDYDIEHDCAGVMEWFYEVIMFSESLTDNELMGLYIAILES